MYYFAFCQGDILLTKELSVPKGQTAPFVVKPWQIVTTLTLDDVSGAPFQMHDEQCTVIRLDNPIDDDRFVMMPLRKSFEVLPKNHYLLAGKCAELLYFDQNSKFCGCCGAPMKWESEINKKCTGCGKQLWPQLQTAVIVRIEKTTNLHEEGDRKFKDQDGPSILMIRAKNFRGSYYGLVAGFVETGETLEECVQREVREEVGIEVEDIQYFGSQPWPYPCGLMVGFTARYKSGELHLQQSELSNAGWFNRNNMPEYPGPVSIAGQLVRDWLNAEH